jgi:hypothetical protein
MTDGNTYAINKHLDEREDYDALQEVTAELERAEAENEKCYDAWLDAQAEIIELEAKLTKAVGTLEFYGGWSDRSGGVCGFDGGSRARTTLAELKG